MVPDSTILAAATPPPAAPPAWRVLTEYAWYVSLFLLIGATIAYALTVAPALRAATAADAPASGGDDRAAADTVARRAGAALGILGPVVVVAMWLQLAGTTANAAKTSFGAGLAPSAFTAQFTKAGGKTDWISAGALLAIQNALYLVAALVLATLLVPSLRTAARVRATAAMAAVLAVLGTVAAAVPTGPMDGAKITSTALTQVHVLGGGTWVGGLVLVTVLALTTRRTPGTADLWAAAWQRFSTTAMVAVGLVLVSGLWLLWMHVGTPGQLVSTTYGRFLLVKLILVLVMLIAGGLNQLSLLPRVARLRRSNPADASLMRLTLRHFPVVVAAEAVLGLAVLVVVPFLSGSARKQAGDTASPVVDGGVLTIGVLFVAMLVLSFVAAVRVGGRLGRREPSLAGG